MSKALANMKSPRSRLVPVERLCVPTQFGDAILVFNQYVHPGRGKSTNSCLRLEDNSVKVDDCPMALGGTQRLITVDGYDIPLDVSNDLLHLNFRPFTMMSGTPSLMPP